MLQDVCQEYTATGSLHDPKNKKYPIDTEEHIRAAWNYIHHSKNSGKYSSEDVKSIKARIAAAWRKKIDKAGPPEATKADMMDTSEDDGPETEGISSVHRGLELARKKLEYLYENNIDGELSDEEVMEYVEEIDHIVGASKIILSNLVK